MSSLFPVLHWVFSGNSKSFEAVSDPFGRNETRRVSAGVSTAPGGVGHRRGSWVEDEGGGGGGADDGDRMVLVADGRSRVVIQ